MPPRCPNVGGSLPPPARRRRGVLTPQGRSKHLCELLRPSSARGGEDVEVANSKPDRVDWRATSECLNPVDEALHGASLLWGHVVEASDIDDGRRSSVSDA